MDTNKKPFNKRAFTAVMSGLTALPLPFTGLVLHRFSESAVNGDSHSWVMLHVGFGVFFVVFASWHAILNRRALLNYITSGVSRSLFGK